MASTHDPPDFAGFSAPDEVARPDELVRYLDEVRDLEAVSSWKALSIDRLVPEAGDVLLDVGCGTGEDVVALARRVAPGGRAIGLDVSRTMVEEARRRWSGETASVEFLVGEVEAIPLAHESVDGVRTERTLQHLADPGLAIAEMARVLRPGGRLVAAEPDWGTLVIDAPDAEAGRVVAGAALGRVRCGDVGRRLRGLLVRAGLEDVEAVARTMLLTDPEPARLALDLPAAAEAAVAQGTLEGSRRDALLAGLASAAAEGVFFAALTAFMAWGRRPEARARPAAGRSR